MPINDLTPRNIQKDTSVEAAAGEIPGYTSVTAFGDNPNVKATKESVYSEGIIYDFNYTAEAVDISSDNANDTLAGTGARVLLLEGLDSDYNEIVELVNMNGLTTVSTVQSFLRVNRARVVAAGTGTTNEGDITGVFTSTPAFFIQEVTGVSSMAQYTIPAGKSGFLKSGFFSGTDESKGVELDFVSASESGVVSIEQRFFVSAGTSPLQLFTSFLAPEKTALRLDAKNLSGGTVEMTGGFELFIRDD